MTNIEDDGAETAKWDAGLTKRVIDVMRPLLRRYFRTEVRGLTNIPPTGGALVVSNHSGGLFAMDVPILAAEFYGKFGYDRPIHTLSHDVLFVGPLGDLLLRTGFIRANRKNATGALRSGHIVVVFPGGDYDAGRPTLSQNTIDFDGRMGYVRTAIEAGVPIAPVVSIGGQENQLFLTRGRGLLERLGPMARASRLTVLPISIGIPFGFSISGLLPPNVPLPTKIVTQVLEPIDIAGQFGEDPDINEVDAHVRQVMQTALDRLGRERRLPILG